MPTSLSDYRQKFDQLAENPSPRLARSGFKVFAGSWQDSSVVKVQRPAWTNRSPSLGAKEARIFFSVWVSPESLEQHRLLYNVHALYLRGLQGYALQSREFAQAFRKKFAPVANHWPQVSIEFGPHTLMQGWVRLSLETVEADAAVLIDRFLTVAPTIDALLEERRKR